MESKGLAKLLKRVNERICALRADSLDTEAAFFCECGWRDCTEPIQLTPRAYLLRTGLFLLAPGHESPRVALPLPWWSVRLRPSRGSRDDVTLSRSSIPGVEK
jgi:hypothetical protein